tara:strand:+ start:79 stop:1041 length:963 start_codon:yes stop_codon:yes gene_type:complete
MLKIKSSLVESKVQKKFETNSVLPKFYFAPKQNTISQKIFFNGIGLHSGKKVKMTLHPSGENTGFIFKLKDGPYSFADIEAKYNNVISTKLCTTLGSMGYSISTTEHILSALYALNIDNVVIELDSNEVPIMDGSSKEFVDSISKEGKEDLNSFKKVIKIKKKVEIREGQKIIRVSPNEETIMTCEIDFKEKVIGKQTISLLLNSDIYTSQICSARTFGFLNQIQDLRKRGLTLGGSLDNAIVVDDNKVLNKDGLRFSDEFVRHKTLDLIGDLSLSGYQMIGSFYSFHGGHDLNNKLLHKIFSSKENWDFVDYSENQKHI